MEGKGVTEMGRAIESFGFLAYWFLELIDGERGLALVSYRFAQPIKIAILINLIGGDR